MLDLNVSLGNIISIAAVVLTGGISYIKAQSSQESRNLITEAKLDKIDKENTSQNVLLTSQDKAISLLTQNLDEKLKQFNAAIEYNKEWRHEVAGEFMRDTGLKVAMLDKEVSLLKMDLGQVKLDLREKR